MTATTVLEVLEAGLLTTVQDLGRSGLGALGIGPGGAADPWSLAVANRLLGNPAGAAALEVTLVGPRLRALSAVTVALAGADFGARVAETGEPVAPGGSATLRPGWTLELPGPATNGIRAYLAVPGGLDVRLVLGSAATALGAGFGGLDGRAVRAGDRLAARGSAPAVAPARWPGPRSAAAADPVLPDPSVVRVLAGPHADATPDAVAGLVDARWTVAPASDRVGLRLDGPLLPGEATGELASHGVTWGAVQVPPDRRPIVLLVDHQPTGGYPVVAVAISADRPRLGQLGPGAAVRFRLVDEAAARRALRGQRAAFADAEAHLAEAAAWDEQWRGAVG